MFQVSGSKIMLTFYMEQGEIYHLFVNFPLSHKVEIFLKHWTCVGSERALKE